MATNDMPLMRNYDSDKEKSEINSNIHSLKIRQQLAVHSVSIDTLLCYYYPKIKCFGNRIMKIHLH